MAYYCVSIGKREYRVSISGSQELVDGESLPVRLVKLNENGLHLLQHQNRATEVYVNMQDPQRYEVMMAGRRVLAQVERPQRKMFRREQPAGGNLLAPLHGVVVKVLAKQGDEVEEGQPLVVLESMKMQMQLRCPFKGKIAAVLTAVGEPVEKGAMLVRIDPVLSGGNNAKS
jgi:biotin carboxyl carrier protein